LIALIAKARSARRRTEIGNQKSEPARSVAPLDFCPPENQFCFIDGRRKNKVGSHLLTSGF